MPTLYFKDAFLMSLYEVLSCVLLISVYVCVMPLYFIVGRTFVASIEEDGEPFQAYNWPAKRSAQKSQ